MHNNTLNVPFFITELGILPSLTQHGMVVVKAQNPRKIEIVELHRQHIAVLIQDTIRGSQGSFQSVRDSSMEISILLSKSLENRERKSL